LEGIEVAGPEDITLFSCVDRTKEPDFFKRFLDEGNKLPGIIASKPIILGGLQLTGGEKVLDAGCGLGDDTFEIAQIVGSQGRALGIDVSETMILEARRRAAARTLPSSLPTCCRSFETSRRLAMQASTPSPASEPTKMKSG
jgi:SAM-dependent methyltransferase